MVVCTAAFLFRDKDVVLIAAAYTYCLHIHWRKCIVTGRDLRGAAQCHAAKTTKDAALAKTLSICASYIARRPAQCEWAFTQKSDDQLDQYIQHAAATPVNGTQTQQTDAAELDACNYFQLLTSLCWWICAPSSLAITETMKPQQRTYKYRTRQRLKSLGKRAISKKVQLIKVRLCSIGYKLGVSSS